MVPKADGKIPETANFAGVKGLPRIVAKKQTTPGIMKRANAHTMGEWEESHLNSELEKQLKRAYDQLSRKDREIQELKAYRSGVMTHRNLHF
jgi:hypothetical protein